MVWGGYNHALTTQTNLIVIIDNLEVTDEGGIMPSIHVLNSRHLNEISFIDDGLKL